MSRGGGSKLRGCGAGWEGRAVERRGLQAARSAWGQGAALLRESLALAWWAREESREIRVLQFTDLRLDFPSPAFTQSWDARGHRTGMGLGGLGSASIAEVEDSGPAWWACV